MAGEADPQEAAQAETGSGDASGAQTSTETAPEGESGAPAGTSDAPRVIELQAIGALQFTDANGQQVKDIPVTPGETVLFRIDNTAGFEHNFYIGTDAELSVPAATTETGIPNWTSGVQELQWTVPEDLSGLKFGCTVPGHYASGMQGTFSPAGATPSQPQPATSPATSQAPGPGTSDAPAMEHEMSPEATSDAEPAASEASAAPAASEASVAPAASEASAGPEASSAPEASVASGAPASTTSPDAAASDSAARVIDLVATASLQFTDVNGQQVKDIPVTPGETVLFRVDNVSNFEHNLYIGDDAQLSAPSATTDIGIPTWTSGIAELEWVVPDDFAGLKFGCTVPGHYPLMQGTFTVSP
jgi:uncharacterized cupredoxin-like copper-binding protein